MNARRLRRALRTDRASGAIEVCTVGVLFVCVVLVTLAFYQRTHAEIAARRLSSMVADLYAPDRPTALGAETAANPTCAQAKAIIGAWHKTQPLDTAVSVSAARIDRADAADPPSVRWAEQIYQGVNRGAGITSVPDIAACAGGFKSAAEALATGVPVQIGTGTQAPIAFADGTRAGLPAQSKVVAAQVCIHTPTPVVGDIAWFPGLIGHVVPSGRWTSHIAVLPLRDQIEDNHDFYRGTTRRNDPAVPSGPDRPDTDCVA